MTKLFEEYELNEDNFERTIINALTKEQIMIVFRKDIKEMDEWCKATYGMNFQTSYEIVRQIAIEKFTNTIQMLGIRGNQTALNIMSNLLNSAKAEQTVKIVFDSKLPVEKEEDKKNDD